MTEQTDADGSTGARETMADVSHTNPHTGQPFGDACAFERGPVVAADGGERGAVAEGDAATEDAGRTMADVDHEHPHADGAAANRVFERGRTDEEDVE